MDTAADLRERLKLKYVGDCKCGHCALVPDELVARASDEIERLRAQRDQLLEALKAVVADIHEYERINNLAPNPGRSECWDSVAHARAAIAAVANQDANSKVKG